MPTAQAKIKVDFLAQPKPEDHARTRVNFLPKTTTGIYARTTFDVSERPKANTTVDFLAWPMHEF